MSAVASNSVCLILLGYKCSKVYMALKFSVDSKRYQHLPTTTVEEQIAESCYPTVHALQSADTGDNETSSKHSISVVVLKVLVKI